MNKKTLLATLLLTLGSATAAYAAVTVEYHNSDDKKHVFEAVCHGSHETLTVDANTTGSATIQGSSPCTVKHAGGEIELAGGEKIEIKGGAISKK